MSGSTADGEDITVGLSQCVTLPNGIKIDTAIARAYRRQGSMNTAMNSLDDSGIHMEVGLIKTNRELGIPSTITEHDITKSPTKDGQRYQLVAHLQHLLVGGGLLLLI